MRLQRLLSVVASIAMISALTLIIGAGPAVAADSTNVVRPGSLHGWSVRFTTDTVRPGFVTGPSGVPAGVGSFRFDTGAPGAAAAGAKVELSNGALNDALVSDLTVLHFDVFLEENGGGVGSQPYLNLKVDTDHDGTIDTTLSYVNPAIPLNEWTEVDPINSDASGAQGWFCTSSTVTCSVSGITWNQVLDLLPAGAVFQNSIGFPRSLIFSAGQGGTTTGQTVRGTVDRFVWSLGDALVTNDFEPPQITAADATVAEPAAGNADGTIQVSLSGPNSFLSPDAPRAGHRGQPVTVHWKTADGTATAGQDYTASSGTLTFDPTKPDTTLPVSIPILADSKAEGDETVLIELTNPVNGVLQRTTATLTITDNDTPPPPIDVQVRPGSLHGWSVRFTTDTVRPGFVTGPSGVPAGVGSFRFDTGAPGAAAAGAKVELSNGALNDALVSDLTVLHFDVFLEENGGGVGSQPYLNLKVDTDHDGTIDTTLSYVNPAIPLNEWTEVDPINSDASGAQGWFCTSSTVTCSVSGITWNQVLDLLPAGAVFQNSIGFPRSLIFSAGQGGTTTGQTVRGTVDRFVWSLGDALVTNDFEPPQITAADATVAEPAAGNADGTIQVSLSGPNSFLSPDAPRAGHRGQPVTVHWKTADGTATAGQDYTASSGTLTFDPTKPDTTLPVSIPILADSKAEGDETVLIELTNPVNGVLHPATATLTITDTPPATKEPGYVPLIPTRLLDTRDGTGAPSGPVAAGGTVELQVSGRAGIPTTAKAVVLNATVTHSSGAGLLTVYPCGDARPGTSTLNYSAGKTSSNMVIVALPADGKVCFYTNAEAQLIADVNGYFSEHSDFVPMTPRRLVDTRTSVTPPVKLPAGSTLSVQATARYGIPDDAAAVSLNLTVTHPSKAGFLTAFPCGTPTPKASTLNFVAGQTIANAVLTKVGSGGKVCVYTNADAHVVVDVGGWFPHDTDFRSLTPERLLDSRSGTGTPEGVVPANHVVELKVTKVGASNIPADAGAVVLNVTVTAPQADGHITVYPCGQDRPKASNINYVKGVTIANAAVAKIGTDGKVCLYTHSATHLVADTTGWFPAT